MKGKMKRNENNEGETKKSKNNEEGNEEKRK